jgi:hypothetical protein
MKGRLVMKALRIIMRALTLILLLSTLICGFYLRSRGITAIEDSSLRFHAAVAVAAIISCAVTFFLPSGRTKSVR